jgi:hypothetical protein
LPYAFVITATKYVNPLRFSGLLAETSAKISKDGEASGFKL